MVGQRGEDVLGALLKRLCAIQEVLCYIHFGAALQAKNRQGNYKAARAGVEFNTSLAEYLFESDSLPIYGYVILSAEV